ncbi:MAG: NAD(P)H-hydrate dehydratase [Saprospiraceae bacterium]|nr:NAD(P)H-hydrate dehydratase [Candidatus Vicinibacter affinis]
MPHKIFSPPQIKAIEELTMVKQDIASHELMERAGSVFTEWFTAELKPASPSVFILCGQGNNGGDGLVIARLLSQQFYKVKIGFFPWNQSSSEDFFLNKSHLPSDKGIETYQIKEPKDLDIIESRDTIIDAILGTGTNRPVSDAWALLFKKINSLENLVVSVDIPSGMLCHGITEGEVIRADEVLSFEFVKLAFLLPENKFRIKNWTLKSIGLDQEAIKKENTPFYLNTKEDISNILRERNRFSYKNSYGHALVIAGNQEMCGAGLLTATACLRSGAGLVSLMTATSCFTAVHSSRPEIICSKQEDLNSVEWKKFQAVAIGPGLGPKFSYEILFSFPLSNPMILDADALNFLATKPDYLNLIPKNSILTPHRGEFSRLAGGSGNELELIEKGIRFSKEHKIHLVIKGSYTACISPDGKVYFNPTGNTGMSTAGSGDVLTGILTGLLAQGYLPLDAARLGVWVHGLAGDLSLNFESEESLLAGDIIDTLGEAFKEIKGD